MVDADRGPARCPGRGWCHSPGDQLSGGSTTRFLGGGRPNRCQQSGSWLGSYSCHGSRRRADDRRSSHDKENAYMLRRAVVAATGLAMATSFGLAGAGTVSAAVPTLKIANGAIWTIEVFGGGCQQEKFNTTSHHFEGVNPIYGRNLERWGKGDHHGLGGCQRPRTDLQRHLRKLAEEVHRQLRWPPHRRERPAGQGSRRVLRRR